MIYVTVHPGSVAPAILKTLDTVLVVGDRPDVRLLELMPRRRADRARESAANELPAGSALYWKVRDPEHAGDPGGAARSTSARATRAKYAEGNLGNARSFYFRGREGQS